MKVQLVVGTAVALLAFAAVPQAHADVYDYGYGPVYGGYSVGNGVCPNGQCSGSYSSLYSATYPVYSAQSYGAESYGPQTCPSGSCGTCPNGSCGMRGQCRVANARRDNVSAGNARPAMLDWPMRKRWLPKWTLRNVSER